MPQHDSFQTRVVTKRVLEVVSAVTSRDAKIKHQKDFAIALGIKPQMISRWISSDANCTLEHVVKICHRFRINPEYLILGSGGMFLGEKPQEVGHRIDAVMGEVAQLRMEMERMSKGNKSASRAKAKGRK